MLSMERVSFHSCFPLCNVSSLLRHTLFSFFAAVLSPGRLLHFTFDELRLRWSLCREGPCHTIRLCNSCVDSNIFSFSEMSRTLCHSAMAARSGTVFLQVSFCQRWRQDSLDAADWKVPCHQTLELYALQPFLGPSIEPMYKNHVYPYAIICIRMPSYYMRTEISKG